MKLRWFVGVPVLTNTLIWLDILLFLVILWLLVVTGILAIQWVMTSAPLSALPAAVSFAVTVSGFFALLFTVGAIFIYRNRYVVLYDFGEDAVMCESMIKWRGPIHESFHVRPFPMEPLYDARKSVAKRVHWADVTEIEPIDGMRIFLLRGNAQRRSVLMRVYCPNDKIYELALETAQKKVGRRYQDEQV